MHCKTILVVLAVAATGSQIAADESEKVLFSFERPRDSQQWQTVNDGVMGGRSDGRFRVNDDNHLEFFGTLSLANNGGFASVRTRGAGLGLSTGDAIILRVRGDGREYSLNLYTPSRLIAFSYRAKFTTKKGEWTHVRLPLDEFVATSFGRSLRNVTLNPADVNGIGILLGDKRPGAFKLEVATISVGK